MIQILKRGEFFGDLEDVRMSPLIHLTETRYTAGRRVPRHRHESAYFCLALAGAYRETYLSRPQSDQGGKTLSYRPLSVAFHPAGETHQGVIGPQGAHCFNIELRRAMFERLYDYALPPDGVADLSGGELNWLALRVYHEHRRADACSPLAIEGLVLEMLAAVARGRKPREKSPPAWLAQAVELIREEYRGSVRVHDIARRIGRHPVHLSRVYRQFQRESIADYTRRLRVHFACRELGKPEASLVDVAFDAGFADQSQFTRAFKQVTGFTPGRFRKTLMT